jgi:ribose/xylose/arabinose/galactoside ABC-type transport system permease subunit
MNEAQATRPDRPISPSQQALAWARTVVRFIGAENLSLVIVLAILVIFIVSQSSFFLLPQNLLNSLGQNIAVLGVIAVGETIVIIGGGLDISVGSMGGVASVVSALVVTSTGSMQLALLSGLAAGLAAGIVNGLNVTVLRVNPIIATLGTYAGFRGLAFLIAPNGYPVPVPASPNFAWLGSGRVLQSGSFQEGIPVILIILIVVAVVGHVVLKYTDFGRSVYAIGGNPIASRLAGINLTKVRVAMYMFSGLLAGLAGVLITARTTAGAPLNGQGLELQAITAVFLGGAATVGGKGTIVGTLLAVLILGVLSNGMNLLGVQTFYQDVATGVLLIVAVAIAQWRAARAERGRAKA